MKVIHIESGFGNQMLDYAEYLAVKKSHPDEECYIEKIIYDIPESHKVISQWNGYELARVFGCDARDIRVIFSDSQWSGVIRSVNESRFWENGWSYDEAISKALNVCGGLSLKNKCQSLELSSDTAKQKLRVALGKFFNETALGYNVRRKLQQSKVKRDNSEDYCSTLFRLDSEDALCGHTLKFMNVNSGIEKISREIKEAFRFPEITDEKNLEAYREITSGYSVAIHARRGDMLSRNGCYYKYGYFSRAVKFIKSKVQNPVFYFFCDPGSIEWCRNNGEIFGLDFSRDNVRFVDWNKGEESYRDMQLMSACRHNIVTNSSFGWWGAYFNENPDKITCSPDARINTTHHF